MHKNIEPKLSAKTVWGKVITYLREKKLISLHIACGEITDVRVEENKFFIRVPEAHLLSIINLPQNLKEIEAALSWQGLSYEIVPSLLEKEEDIKEQDQKLLEKTFGKYFKMKD